MKVRITPTIIGFLRGTQAWADAARLDVSDEDPAAVSLMRKLRKGPLSKTQVIDLEVWEMNALMDYAEALQDVARENVGDRDMAALGELNAARALIHQLSGLGVE